MNVVQKTYNYGYYFKKFELQDANIFYYKE